MDEGGTKEGQGITRRQGGRTPGDRGPRDLHIGCRETHGQSLRKFVWSLSFKRPILNEIFKGLMGLSDKRMVNSR